MLSTDFPFSCFDLHCFDGVSEWLLSYSYLSFYKSKKEVEINFLCNMVLKRPVSPNTFRWLLPDQHFCTAFQNTPRFKQQNCFTDVTATFSKEIKFKKMIIFSMKDLRDGLQNNWPANSFGIWFIVTYSFYFSRRWNKLSVHFEGENWISTILFVAQALCRLFFSYLKNLYTVAHHCVFLFFHLVTRCYWGKNLLLFC